MIIFCLDPGTEKTGYSFYDTEKKVPLRSGEAKNAKILNGIRKGHIKADALACEGIVSYGKRIGQEVIKTCKFLGAVEAVWTHCVNNAVVEISKPDINSHICDNRTARDKDIRAALVDRFGGSDEVAFGNKKNPGPLYELQSSHTRSALAVGITADEKKLFSDICQHKAS